MPAKPTHSRRPTLLPLVLLLALADCGTSSTATAPTYNCDGVTATTLAVGGHSIIDPATTTGCLRLPAAGAGGAEYLVVAYSAAGQERGAGVAGNFTLVASGDTFAPTVRPLVGGFGGGTADAFHTMLRQREREIARGPGIAFSRTPAVRAVPPTVGSQRSFEVCATFTCTSFTTVAATARYVGAKNAVYLDNSVPVGGYTANDLSAIGGLFDQDLYRIDTTAFGRESDIDGNGVVAVLLSNQINGLSPNCNSTGQVILGYFFGADLDVTRAHSNAGEVFYSLVPDPGNTSCTISKAFAQARLASTFIHEFQHMISFNRHVLLGGGGAEETWLNEGLSHFAEELGGRQVADSFCASGNCFDTYASPNVRNAFGYLTDPAANFLVEPGNSSGTLEERGANWLFVRWLADRSPTDSLLGTDITRLLDGAGQGGGVSLTGGQNVVAAAALFQPGVSFATLAGEWHLSNYLETLPGFVDAGGRLHYKSWDLVSSFNTLFPGPYPLHPDSTGGNGYGLSGVLRGGSGTYLRVVQPGSAPAVAIGLATGNAASVAPRYAVVRIR